MDEIDVAQTNDEFFRQVALRAHFAGSRKIFLAVTGPMAGPLPDGGMTLPHKLCCDCDDELNPARLEASPGTMRCVVCQTKTERRAQHGLV